MYCLCIQRGADCRSLTALLLTAIMGLSGCQTSGGARRGQLQLTAARPIELRVDHVTIAGTDLARMRDAFASAGLGTEYGGAHDNGVTHMAFLGFDDGSYIELISAISSDHREIPIWGDHIANNGGPCGWAARSDNVADELARVSALGVTMQGPFPGSRRRPDGKTAAWSLGFLGDQPPGATLPFIIEDTAPRHHRVQPSPSVAGSELTGVALVVIGVEDLDDAVARFRRVYGWPAPWVREDQDFGATLASYQGTPVVLATPLTGDNWLARRLERLGESPCAYLIGTSDIRAASRRFGLKWTYPWLGRHVAWFDPADLDGTRLGLID